MNVNEHKQLARLTKSYRKRVQRRWPAFSYISCFSADSRYLIQRTSQAERRHPVPLPARLGTTQREAHLSGAGSGCRKKPWPCRNRANQSLDVTRHEYEPTSEGSFVARVRVECSIEGEANGNAALAADWCLLSELDPGRH